MAVAAAIVGSVTAGAASPVPGTPAPPQLPPIQAQTLGERYAVNRGYIADAERAAHRLGDSYRESHLRQLGSPVRQFLSFDAQGDGQAVEVLGDLATADRIVVLVPGADTTLDTFDHLGSRHASLSGGAHALHDEMRRLSRSSVAVLAWYGYRAPRTMSRDVATTARAEEGGRRLTTLLGELRTANTHAPVAFLCHSYGSVVCGRALGGMSPRTSAGLAGVAVFGSPGTGLRSAAGLPVRVPVWAGRGARDWIARAPHVSWSAFGTTLGFGTDPTSPSFGARPFGAGNSGHSGYLEPGSTALRNLALIGLGRGSVVSGG
ncbi:alpha/beta hydrolase [Streptomyces sp. NPDC007100]|uniref:alpha/beta hydrolase n=1 Tax=Streptomyces sp. NPDC007100 TaxID=3155602 RepID=UPI0033E3E661